MYSKLKRIAKKIDEHLWENICTFFIIVTLILIMAQIIARYLFGIGLWMGVTQDVPRVMLMWYTFIAMAVALKKGGQGHFNFDLIRKKATPKIALRIDIIADICIACFLIFMLKYGFEFYLLITGDRATSLGFDRNLFYLPLPLGGFLGLVYLVRKWINFYQERLLQRKCKLIRSKNKS